MLAALTVIIHIYSEWNVWLMISILCMCAHIVCALHFLCYEKIKHIFWLSEK